VVSKKVLDRVGCGPLAVYTKCEASEREYWDDVETLSDAKDAPKRPCVTWRLMGASLMDPDECSFYLRDSAYLHTPEGVKKAFDSASDLDELAAMLGNIALHIRQAAGKYA